MKTRAELNTSIDSLSQVDDVLINSYVNVFSSVNLKIGGLLTLGNVHGAKGEQVDLPLFFFKGSSSIATLQCDIVLPSEITFVSSAIGPAATDAQKSIQTALVTLGVRVLLFGLNQNILATGLLATFRFLIAPGALSSIGSLSLTGIVGSTAAGTQAALSGCSGTVLVQ